VNVWRYSSIAHASSWSCYSLSTGTLFKFRPLIGHGGPQEGSRGIALLFVKLRRKMGVCGERHPLSALPPGKRLGTHCAGKLDWHPEPVWTGTEDLAPTGIRSPYRPAVSESLHRLSYPSLLLTVYSGSLFSMSLCGRQWETIHGR